MNSATPSSTSNAEISNLEPMKSSPIDVPAELVEQIVQALEINEVYERFDELTSASRGDILNARLVSRTIKWGAIKSFAKVVGQSRFDSTRASMESLDALSRIPDVTCDTLTFSGKHFAPFASHPIFELSEQAEQELAFCR